MTGPLAGIRVLELGSLIAGPFCAKTLADFGAEVIKVEPPGDGDPLRRWRRMRNDTSLWWQVQSRNKRSITVDMRQAAGQEIVRDLAARADIVIENFRPGALEKWNLGWDVLAKANPRLVMVRISGYGQTGPYRERPGFAEEADGFGGVAGAVVGEAAVDVGVHVSRVEEEGFLERAGRGFVGPHAVQHHAQVVVNFGAVGLEAGADLVFGARPVEGAAAGVARRRSSEPTRSLSSVPS